jgi:hypothetical protein
MSRLRAGTVAGVVAVLSAVIAASTAFAAVSPEMRAVWRFASASGVDTQSGPYRLRAGGTREVDPNDPWTAGRSAPTFVKQPEELRFHRWRALDETDPWTGTPITRVTPPLSRAQTLE